MNELHNIYYLMIILIGTFYFINMTTYNIIVGYALTLKCVATVMNLVQSTFATFTGLL